MIEIFKAFKVSLLQLPQAMCKQQHLLSLKGQQLLGENFTHAATKESLSHIEKENDDMETQETEVDCPDLEASRARGFVHRPLEPQSFEYGNPIS
nr:hypothetical protein [Tanacetum cinerariifolium]